MTIGDHGGDCGGQDLRDPREFPDRDAAPAADDGLALLDGHSCQMWHASSGLVPSASAAVVAGAPTSSARWPWIGCQRISHGTSADVQASSASPSCAVRPAGHDSTSAHRAASS